MRILINDYALIDQGKQYPDSEIMYDPIRGCLCWTDEILNGISPDVYDLLIDFSIARDLLYHRPQTGLSTDHYYMAEDKAKNIIETVKKTFQNYRGLTRFNLTKDEMMFYRKSNKDPDPF